MFRYRNRIPRDLFPVLLVLWSVSFVGATTSDSLAQAAQEGTSGAAQLSCSPDRPLTQPGTEVRVRAFADFPQETKLQYAWTAAAGKVRGSDSEASWSFKDVLPGRYKATVVVSSARRKVADCSVSVLVVEGERGAPTGSRPEPKRETARGFLLKGETEKAGYGLYSYFLLGSPPIDSSRARYLKAIQAYLHLVPTVSDLEDYVSADKLNITYLPIKSPLPANPTAEWLLDNYDFARARVLLDLLPGAHNVGPYFVSVLKPLRGAGQLSGQYLFQNLSAVPAESQDLISLWILEFMNLAAQERFWEPKTAELLTLKLRSTISVLAAGLPEVKKQLASWVAWTG
jgi:hypothetical protein